MKDGLEAMRDEDTTATVHGGFTQQIWNGGGGQISHGEQQREGYKSQREIPMGGGGLMIH